MIALMKDTQQTTIFNESGLDLQKKAVSQNESQHSFRIGGEQLETTPTKAVSEKQNHIDHATNDFESIKMITDKESVEAEKGYVSELNTLV